MFWERQHHKNRDQVKFILTSIHKCYPAAHATGHMSAILDSQANGEFDSEFEYLLQNNNNNNNMWKDVE